MASLGSILVSKLGWTMGFSLRLLWLLVLFANRFIVNLQAIEGDKLNELVTKSPNPFQYDLHMKMLPGAKQDADVLICMHGMGSDYRLAEIMQGNPVIPYHLIAFNFPDHGLGRPRMKTTYGTIEELLPALYVWKRCVMDAGVDKVHLYGFSAGGGAIVNALAVLNSDRYDKALKSIGIGPLEKRQILESIQKGSVILEVPLKSFDEIADLFGNRETRALALRARKNGMVPIKNLSLLQGLSLNCFVYFAYPDEAVGNRDDKEFIRSLQDVNKNGRTIAIIGKTAGHTSYHPELWHAYKNIQIK